MKQGYIIHSERGCVHTCSNCNERIELFYPDGTEVVTLPYCPYCGCSLGEKSEASIPFKEEFDNELNEIKEIISQNLKGVLQLEIDNLANELIKYYQPRKKEIERLKDENCHDYHCMCLAQQENAEQKAEIERLTISVKSYEMADLCKQAYIDQLKEENKELVSAKVFELEKEKTELQKQVEAWKLKTKELEEAWEISSKNEVELSKSNDSKLIKILKLQEQMDELTEQNKNLKYSLDTANSYIEKLAESCETNCKKFNGITTQQAVKDIAKEIYNELKTEVISVDIPRGGEPAEEDCEAVLWWKIEQILRKKAQVE